MLLMLSKDKEREIGKEVAMQLLSLRLQLFFNYWVSVDGILVDVILNLFHFLCLFLEMSLLELVWTSK